MLDSWSGPSGPEAGTPRLRNYMNDKHPEEVKKYNGSLTQLAIDIGNLRYDKLAEFLDALRIKLASDTEQDNNAKRAKLAVQLNEAAINIEGALTAIENAWEISRPFMENRENYPDATQNKAHQVPSGSVSSNQGTVDAT